MIREKGARSAKYFWSSKQWGKITDGNPPNQNTSETSVYLF